MTSPEPQVASMSFYRDIKVASLRKLLSGLHALLDARGYIYEYDPQETEIAAIDNIAGFKDGLVSRRDSPRRDRAYLVLGIILLPTILFTTLGISFIRQSRYTLRTVVSISVERETHHAEDNKQGQVQGEVPDTLSNARITVELRAGTAKGDTDIWKPADTRREVIRLVEERRLLEEGLSELLLSID
ncbi:MAG: hypothetical protein JSW38_06020 [Dehalococcoidia bacterium]|nr:MAG: hypothetical protein JSW38_06020 [Dehalococcoidia bacterium]